VVAVASRRPAVLGAQRVRHDRDHRSVAAHACADPDMWSLEFWATDRWAGPSLNISNVFSKLIEMFKLQKYKS
jgi:hypothetical protein